MMVCKVRGERDPCGNLLTAFLLFRNFLDYLASGQELEDFIVMKLHQSVLADAVLLDRPRSRRELLDIIRIMEEKICVKRGEVSPLYASSDSASIPPTRNSPRLLASVKCWNCGRLAILNMISFGDRLLRETAWHSAG
jgi:hypothetical protein